MPKRRNIATLRYTTKYGIDFVVFRTKAKKVEDLPPITNASLEETGALEPEVEGADASEEAEWENILPYDQLPVVEAD